MFIMVLKIIPQGKPTLSPQQEISNQGTDRTRIFYIWVSIMKVVIMGGLTGSGKTYYYPEAG
jgi:hypothetical protein